MPQNSDTNPAPSGGESADGQAQLSEQDGVRQQQPEQQPRGQGAHQGSPRGEAAPQATGPSLTDKLQRPDVTSRLKTMIGSYALVGAGVGLSGYVFLGQLLGGSGGSSPSITGAMVGLLVALSLLVSTMVLGIGIGVIFGLYYGDEFPVDLQTSAVATGLGSYAGFVVMTLITVLLVGAQVSGAGGDGGGISISLGDQFLPLLLSGIPAGLVGGSTVYLKETFGFGD